MGFDWNKASEPSKDGSQDKEKIPAGERKIKIVKVVFGKGKGDNFTKFESSNGDPQIMLIFADDQARETSFMVTLSEKAGWVLAGILKASGADMAKMTARDIPPEKFAEETFANAQLVGRVLTAEVSYKDNGYAEIKPLRARQTVPADDDIPI